MVHNIPSKFVKFLGENKEWLITWFAMVIVVLLLVHFWPGPPNPIPPEIRKQAKFTILYPQGYSIATSSWKYLTDTDSVQFTAVKSGVHTVFTEEVTPLEYQDDAAAYNRFIGSLRPIANFNVALGIVTVANFVTAGDFQIVGKTGILNTHGTLVLAHPDTEIADEQWRDLFESLKTD